MQDRLKKIERIKQVQARLHQLEEWKLAQIDRQKAENDADRKSMIEALNQDDALQGIFIDAMSRRLAHLAREADRIGRARVAQDAALVEAGLKLKRTERMGTRARSQKDEAQKKKGFESLLQSLFAVDKASLP